MVDGWGSPRLIIFEQPLAARLVTLVLSSLSSPLINAEKNKEQHQKKRSEQTYDPTALDNRLWRLFAHRRRPTRTIKS